MDTIYLHIRYPVLHQCGEGSTVNGADGSKGVYTELLVHIFHCIGPGKSTSHSQFDVFTGIESGTAAAAEGLFTDGIFRHLKEVITYILKNISWLIKKSHAP